jgi:hypothetical protein
MMDANNKLSHEPPATWTCYTPDGAEAAGNSNISSAPGVLSVDSYMIDNGNETTLGHRRWILSNSLGPVGLGSTSGASCMWTLGGSGDAGREWTSFPSPGVFPIEAVTTLWWSDLNETGWSLQSDDINLDNAKVSVTADGQSMPMKVSVLLPLYGAHYAISMIPDGWTMETDTHYEVEVTGISKTISYDFYTVTCKLP